MGNASLTHPTLFFTHGERPLASRLAHVSPEQSVLAGPPDAWPVCTIGVLRDMLRDEHWTLVEFWAPDCLFSRLLAPVRRHVQSHLGDRLRLLCCTLEGVETSASAFGAEALPALVLFYGATRVRRWLGAVDVTLLEYQIAQTLAAAKP